jgi:hypothetical protein
MMKEIDASKLRSLSQLMYKTVKVITKDGEVIEGDVMTYDDPFETDNGLESVGVNYGEYILSFDMSTIEKLYVEEE